MSYSEVIDIKSAKERFMGNEALYKKFLYQLPEKGMLEDLKNKLEDQDAGEAFKVAHTMKGVVGNLSLYKLMDAVSKVVEVLRVEKLPEEASVTNLEAAYEEALAAIAEVKEQDIQLF